MNSHDTPPAADDVVAGGQTPSGAQAHDEGEGCSAHICSLGPKNLQVRTMRQLRILDREPSQVRYLRSPGAALTERPPFTRPKC
jgi:hypothetical protein